MISPRRGTTNGVARRADRALAPLVLATDGRAERERSLVARVREGEREAFGELVELHLSHALALAIRLLRRREDAEDLVQDAFLAALQHIDDFELGRPFWPWLCRIIVNRGLDMAASRSLRAADVLSDQLFDTGPSPVELTERSEVASAFQRTLASLPPRRRLVLQLFEVDGFSIAEIAALLDTAPATIRWHLHVSRRQLRKTLAPFRGGEG